MWPCDKHFEQDELARWEKDVCDTRIESKYEGNEVGKIAKGERQDANATFNRTKDKEGKIRSGLRDGLDRPERLWGFSTESQTPALLLLCRDSRNAALEHYQLLFSLWAAFPRYISTLFETRFSSIMIRSPMITQSYTSM